GQGSEFAVRLPALPAEAVSPECPIAGEADGQASPLPRQSRQRRILLVDDNVDAAESLSMLLGLQGHEVRVAHDGQTALRAAEEFQPEVVLLDIGLPRMDGNEVARRLRERPESAGMLLVALTGYGQDEDRRRSQEAGFNAHLLKPVDLAALQGLLEGSESL